MRGPPVRPRHDQVAELTRGVRLPLAPIAHEHLEILAELLRQAFDDVRAHEPATVATGEEPEVTALMQARLNSLDSSVPQLVSAGAVDRSRGQNDARRAYPGGLFV